MFVFKPRKQQPTTIGPGVSGAPASPLRPIRAVRPTRCTKALGSCSSQRDAARVSYCIETAAVLISGVAATPTNLGRVELDNPLHVWNVQAAGRHIGAQQHT